MKVHYFGAPAVAAGNSKQIRKDTTLTISITVIVLILIFLLFFKSVIAPIQIMIPVIYGGLFALTIIFFIKGY